MDSMDSFGSRNGDELNSPSNSHSKIRIRTSSNQRGDREPADLLGRSLFANKPKSKGSNNDPDDISD